MTDQNKDIEKNILKLVENTILKYNMLKPNDAVLIGVSGGPDSVALLDILIQFKKEFSLSLGIAHLNHGLRGKAADRDEAFVTALARKLDIPCYCEKINVKACRKQFKLSLEHTARRVRYSFFLRTSACHGYGKIALGHQKDDNAEMILMALCRGSGPLGISGIPPIRDGVIIRPLIELPRSDLQKYLTEKGLTYVVDQSNFNTDYVRNRIRSQLLPLLRNGYNPKITESLNRLSGILRSEEEWIEEVLRPVFEKAVLYREKDALILSIARLGRIHPAAKRRVLRMAISQIKGNLKRITLGHIDGIIHLMEMGPVRGRLDLPDRVLILRRNDQVIISKINVALRQIRGRVATHGLDDFLYLVTPPETVLVRETGSVITFYEKDIENTPEICSAGQHVAFIDIINIKYPLILRNFKSEDRFVPLGMTGSQSVTKFLKNQKVPEEYRQKVPVLTDRDRVIWIAGYRIDTSVRITSTTRRVLVAKTCQRQTKP